MFIPGAAFGSYILPHDPGTAGGGTEGGLGGGVIRLEISRDLHLDGLIRSLGSAATDGDSGGGSGGSVRVVATTFSGHGEVSVEGGRGHGHGYGGAGGRIAVRVLWRREYAGRYVAYGGHGGDMRSTDARGNAAAGTVYYTSSASLTSREYINTTSGITFKDDFRMLYIDNDNRNHQIPTVIENDDGSSLYEFEEIQAYNHVVLEMTHPNAELIVHKFKGDRTGLFRLLSGQKIHVEYVSSALGYTVAPVSYEIASGAEIVLPSTVFLLGTRTLIRGKIVNVHNLTAAEGARSVFYSTAQTAVLQDGTYSHLTEPGNITFAALTVQRGSVLDLSHIGGELTLRVDTFRVKYNGVVNINRGLIESNEGVIESEGLVNLNGVGYVAESGPGQGVTSDNGHGHGASHGGHGGTPKGMPTGKLL